MKHRDSLPALPGLLMIVVLLAALNSQLAIAQAPSNGANDQPFFYPAPVAGFNPVTASDADLAALGFPKRPAAADPYYATWVQKMSNAKHRVENPLATATEAVHLPKNRGTNAPTSRLPAGLVANGSTSSDSTVSWSGAEVLSQQSRVLRAERECGLHCISAAGVWVRKLHLCPIPRDNMGWIRRRFQSRCSAGRRGRSVQCELHDVLYPIL